MTYRDVLVQTLAELTGEPEASVEDFMREWEKRSPNKMLDKKLSPPEAETLRVAFRESTPGPIADLVRETVASFRSWKRGTRYSH